MTQEETASSYYQVYHQHYDQVRNLGIEMIHSIQSYAQTFSPCLDVQRKVIKILTKTVVGFTSLDLISTITYETSRTEFHYMTKGEVNAK